MALFGQQTRKDDSFSRAEDKVEAHVDVAPYPAPVAHAPVRHMEDSRPAVTTPMKNSESILAAGLTIEGKIECSGNIRVAGRPWVFRDIHKEIPDSNYELLDYSDVRLAGSFRFDRPYPSRSHLVRHSGVMAKATFVSALHPQKPRLPKRSFA